MEQIRRWFSENKKFLIVVGIIGVLLSLFFVPSLARVSYEQDLNKAQGEKSGSPLLIFPEVVGKPMENLDLMFSQDSMWGYYTNCIGPFWLVYLIVIAVLKVKMAEKHGYEKIEHGSGDWCRNGEEYKVLSPKEGMILADKEYLPVVPTPPTAKNGNVLVIGGSGAGKSASFVIPNALQALGSYIFTDPKGELYDRTAGYYKAIGYEVHTINLADPKFSDGYNPLSHIRNTIDVDIISHIIVNNRKENAKGGDPFWDETAKALLSALIYYLLATRPPEEQSLASCLALTRLGGENEGQAIKDLFMSLPFEHPARKNFETIRLASEKTFSSILISLAAKLNAFDSEEIAALTSTNTIEFEDIAKKKSVVFVITPESHSTYDFLLTIFFSQMLQRLYDFADKNGGSLPIPTFFILDEFANIGRIPNFEKILSTCRSKKLHISIILQSIDQLMEIYDEKVTENIMANCSTQLFLGSNAQKTLENFSKLLGEKTIVRDSMSTSKDKAHNVTGSSYSDQSMARALMTPDELRRMDPGECIIFIQGMKPIKARKYFYFKMHPKRELAKNAEVSHLDIGQVKRGEYRIFNPYKMMDEFNSLELGGITVDQGTLSSKEPPAIGSAEGQDYDIQKELEEKFDELFGELKKKNDMVTSNSN